MPRSRIRVDSDGAVAVVTLAHPESGNSIDEVMAAELREALSDLDDADDVRAVVLTGDGPHFCRGSALPDRPSAEQIASHSVAPAVAAMGKPTVAALEGDVLGQGLELALGCDLRYASTDARMGLPQAAEGAIPWDGGTQRLPRLIGRSRALHLMLLARVVDGREDAEIGLVAGVVPAGQALPRAMEAARVIATHGPVALRYLKEAVYGGADLTLDQGMRLEVDLATLLHSTGDRAEGLRAFAERRRPEFSGE